MATIETLQAQKYALEQRLSAGDLSAETALAQIDRAIAARLQKIAYSQKRLAAVKNAVKAGMALADTAPKKAATTARKRLVNKPINRF